MRALLAGSLAAVLASGSTSARADDPAAAQALFTEAKKLMGAGKYAEACPKLEESDRVAPAIGTKFNLADCYEHTGKTASAWAEFLSVAAGAKNANQGAREKAARDRAKALEPKLSRIAVAVPDPTNVSGLEVKRDDGVIGSAEWGEAMPVDPGEHTVSATAPGKRPWKAIVEVQGSGGSAKVIVPPLDDQPAAPVSAATPATPASSPSDASPPPENDSSGARTRHTVGWVLLGTGVAAAIGGGVFWAMRSSEASTLQGECDPNTKTCPAGASGDISSGKTDDAVSVTLFVVGGAAILTGAGLLLFGNDHPSKTSAAQLVPMVGPQGGGLRLVGEF